MKPNKTLAAGLAAALMAGSLTAIASVGLASSASAAGPSTAGLFCDVSGISSSVANWSTTWSVNVNGTPAPATAAAGDTVNANLTYANGPNNGGPAVVGRAKAIIEVVQGATVVQTLTTPWTPDVAVAGGTAVPPGQFPGATLATSFTAPAAGSYDVQVKDVVFEGYLGGGSSTGFLAATVNCNNNDTLAGPNYQANNPTNNQIPFGATGLTTTAPVVPPSATVATSSAQLAGAQYIARNGNYTRTITLTGSNFDASDSTGTVAFCDAAGANCDTTAGTTNTLATDGSGALTGSIVIAATDTLTSGSRSIKISGLSSGDVVVPVHVLGTPVIVLGAASGFAGGTVTVAGSEFNTGGTGSVYGSTSGTFGSGLANHTTDAAVAVTASATGTFTTTYTASDLTTASIVGTQGTPGPPSVDRATGFSPYTVSADTLAPTGSATVTPTSGAMGLTAKVTLSNINDNAGAAGVTKTVAWGDGATSSLGSGVNVATHKFSKLGTYTVKVTLKDAANNTTVLTAGVVKTKDVIKPVMKIAALNSSAKKVKAISGSITDNVAPRYAKIKLVEKRGSKWYYYNGSSWKKSSKNTKAGALAKAKWLTDTTVSSKKFSISVKGMAKGSLVVAYYGIDKAGNKSAVKYLSKTLKK